MCDSGQYKGLQGKIIWQVYRSNHYQTMIRQNDFTFGNLCKKLLLSLFFFFVDKTVSMFFHRALVSTVTVGYPCFVVETQMTIGNYLLYHQQQKDEHDVAKKSKRQPV